MNKSEEGKDLGGNERRLLGYGTTTLLEELHASQANAPPTHQKPRHATSAHPDRNYFSRAEQVESTPAATVRTLFMLSQDMLRSPEAITELQEPSQHPRTRNSLTLINCSRRPHKGH